MPTKDDNDVERSVRVDRMLKELAILQERAERLAEEVRQRTTRIAKEVLAIKGRGKPRRSN